MKYLYIALSSIILAYVIIALFTYLYQRKLLYHPSENNYTGDEIQFEYKEVFIEVDKDIKLKSWFLEKDLKKDKTILYFHGNAGDLTNRVHKLNELNKFNVNILIISWRGFSGNPVKPTKIYFTFPNVMSVVKMIQKQIQNHTNNNNTTT